MRTHTIPFYCLAIGQCVGVLFEKIFQYEVAEKEYKFKVRFTPITRVKKSDFGQPISYGGQTFFFGHDIMALYEMAAIVKREHDDVIRAQISHIEFVARRLKDAWENVTAAVNQELELIGQPAVESTAAAQTAVSQDYIDKSDARTGHQNPQEPEGEQGQIRRRITAFNVYVASTRPPGAEKGCGSAAYCAIIHNIATGEYTEFAEGFGARSLSRLDVLALCAVFESGNIPHSTRDSQTVVTVHAANEFIANMFSKGILKKLAENDWITQEGKDARNKEEWKRVIAHTSHMTVKGAVPGKGDGAMERCVMLAQNAAKEEYTKKFGALPPPGYNGGKQ